MCVFCNHQLVFASFITNHRICNKSNTKVATSGATTSRTPEFVPVCSGLRVVHIIQLHLNIFSSVLYCPPRFLRNLDVQIVFTPIVYGLCVIYVICTNLRVFWPSKISISRGSGAPEHHRISKLFVEERH